MGTQKKAQEPQPRMIACPQCTDPKAIVIERWIEIIDHIPHVVTYVECKGCGFEGTTSTED